MSRARSAVAVQTTVEKLMEAAKKAFGVEIKASETFDDFYDCASHCRSLTEELGGEEGSDAWYFWQHGDWAVMGDLGLLLHLNEEALCTLNKELGTVIVTAIDLFQEYAHFSAYEEGRQKRKLVQEDGEFLAEGLPVKHEKGMRRLDFTEEEAERIWTAYKLPTFEYDPQKGPFIAVNFDRLPD